MEIPIYEFGPFRFDARRLILTESGKRVHVTRKAAQVLKMLVEHAGETVFKEILIDEVWGATGDKPDYLAVKICELRGRKVLDDDPKDPKFIKTEHGEGYKFIHDFNVERVGGDGNTEVTGALAAKTEAGRALAGKIEEIRALAAKMDETNATIPKPIKYVDPALSREKSLAEGGKVRILRPEDIRGGYWTLKLSDDAIAQIKANSTQPKTRRVEFRSRVVRGKRTWTMRIPGRGRRASENVPFDMQKLIRSGK